VVLVALAAIGLAQARHGRAPMASVAVDARHTGRVVPKSFLGISVEWDSVSAYAGPARQRRIALIRLLRSVGRPLALRVGGDSADQAWWNPGRRRRPPTVLQNVTPETVDSVGWLARGLRGPVTLGVNLALSRPANALALARAAERRLPRGALRTVEVGNEPDLYSSARTFRVPGHVHRRLRKRTSYGPRRYGRDVARYLRVLKADLPRGTRFAVAGFAGGGWWSSLPGLVHGWRTRRLVISAHLYAIPSCRGPNPPLSWLESPAASRGVASKLRAVAGFAHRHALPMQVTEMNSAPCGGRPGLSNRFAAALWLADTLFALLDHGVAQVDVHTWNHARYAPFALAAHGVRARPPFAGLLAFAKAAPSGSRLVGVRVRGGNGLRAWATVDKSGTKRVLLIAPRAVRARVARRCARLWLATARGRKTRRTCFGRIALPATSVAVLTYST
jgi:hypothetical protein